MQQDGKVKMGTEAEKTWPYQKKVLAKCLAPGKT